eukprot:SAG22_NODE_6398_length_861_cov_1.198163_2_plen_94_part_01
MLIVLIVLLHLRLLVLVLVLLFGALAVDCSLYLNSPAAGPNVDAAGEGPGTRADDTDLEIAGTFDGGAFAFNDSGGDVVVEPRRGRLLAFPSGV